MNKKTIKKATLKEVAELANVSVATAGRVLGKYGNVGGERTQKVLNAAKQLSYTPNVFARSLKTSQMKTIGLVLTDIQNPFYSQILSSIENTARLFGYTLFVCNSDDDLKAEILLVKNLINKGVDGIIIVSSCCIDSSIENSIEEKEFSFYNKINVPIIFIDRAIPKPNYTAVLVDNVQSGYDSVKYLIDMNHKKIGIIAPSKTRTIEDRILGCMQAFIDGKLEWDSRYLLRQDRKDLNNKIYLNEWIDANSDITAFILLNNVPLASFLNIMKTKNKRFPDDYSLLNWDDTSLAKYLNITTMQQPAVEMGNLAVTKLISYINSNFENITIEKSLLPTKINIRNSCKSL